MMLPPSACEKPAPLSTADAQVDEVPIQSTPSPSDTIIIDRSPLTEYGIWNMNHVKRCGSHVQQLQN